MATTAMLAVKPFETMARITAPFTGLGSSQAKLLFLHTTGLNPSPDLWAVPALTGSHSHVIHLHAGKEMPGKNNPFPFDASASATVEPAAITSDYKIIKKGYLRIGIITAKPGEQDVIQKTATLSAFLKKVKNCHMVVCLSQLGYQHQNAADDLTLAKKSTHIDVIIGGHKDNFHAHPVIALNQTDKEVIIHSAPGDPAACGILNFDFDGYGQKRSIGFTA